MTSPRSAVAGQRYPRTTSIPSLLRSEAHATKRSPAIPEPPIPARNTRRASPRSMRTDSAFRYPSRSWSGRDATISSIPERSTRRMAVGSSIARWNRPPSIRVAARKVRRSGGGPSTDNLVFTTKLISPRLIVTIVSDSIGHALDALRAGRAVLVYDADGREEETDAVLASQFVALVGETLRQENGWGMEALGREFRAPGHVALLNAADGLLAKRRGHTELSTALVTMAGLIPSATICEMMGDDGRALSKEDAKAYAEARNLVFLQGKDVVEAWRAWSG